MNEPTLSALVSTLTPEAAEQWRALVEADDRARSLRAAASAVREKLLALSAREHARPRPGAEEQVEDYECDFCDGPCEYYPRVEHEAPEPLTDGERRALARLRAVDVTWLEFAAEEHEKAKRAPARWLEERGLLDGLWKALWRERHQRGET